MLNLRDLSPASGTTEAHSAAAAALLEAASAPGLKLVSFDVFDTVVTRRLSEPAAVFERVGERLQSQLPGITPAAFRALRLAAERRARRNRPGREVSLAEIHAELAFSLGRESLVDTLVATELDVERELIYPLPEMRRVVAEIRRRFGRVVYISDMYLPEDFVAGRLRAFGLFTDRDALYLSSTCGGWKGDGRLYQTVLATEGLEPGELLHCGNSLEVDVGGARRAGLRACAFTPANPLPSEAILDTTIPGAGSTLAGVSREVRLQAPALGADARTAWDTGAALTGPLLFLYASWVVQRAAELGLRRLLFLARDAYLPYRVTQRILAARPELGIEAHYAYGSRATYLPLGMPHLGEADWDRLTTHRGQRYRTLAELERVLMADDGSLRPHLEQLGVSAADPHRTLSEAELDTLKRHALAEGAFAAAVQQSLDAFVQRSRDYFAGFGLRGSGGIGLVDTGWSTVSHAPLFRFLTDELGQPLRLFYVGLGGTEAHVPLSAVEAFLYNRVAALGVRDPQFSYPRALETLLMAPHGRTEGFRRTGARIEPILSATDNAAFVAGEFPVYQEAILAFVDLAVRRLPVLPPWPGCREAADQLLRRFWSEPTPAEARLWAALEWEADPLGARKYPLARGYRGSDGWAAFVQKRFPELYPQFWREAAVQLTPRRTLTVLRAAILARRVLGQLARLAPTGSARRARALSRRAIARHAARAERLPPLPSALDRKPA